MIRTRGEISEIDGRALDCGHLSCHGAVDPGHADRDQLQRGADGTVGVDAAFDRERIGAGGSQRDRCGLRTKPLWAEHLVAVRVDQPPGHVAGDDAREQFDPVANIAAEAVEPRRHRRQADRGRCVGSKRGRLREIEQVEAKCTGTVVHARHAQRVVARREIKLDRALIVAVGVRERPARDQRAARTGQGPDEVRIVCQGIEIRARLRRDRERIIRGLAGRVDGACDRRAERQRCRLVDDWNDIERDLGQIRVVIDVGIDQHRIGAGKRKGPNAKARQASCVYRTIEIPAQGVEDVNVDAAANVTLRIEEHALSGRGREAIRIGGVAGIECDRHRGTGSQSGGCVDVEQAEVERARRRARCADRQLIGARRQIDDRIASIRVRRREWPAGDHRSGRARQAPIEIGVVSLTVEIDGRGTRQSEVVVYKLAERGDVARHALRIVTFQHAVIAVAAAVGGDGTETVIKRQVERQTGL